MMLSYYIHEFVPDISVAVVPSSFYTSLYIPLAFYSEGVHDALIACAALHASRHASEQSRYVRLKALSQSCQRRCHDFLKERIALSGHPFKDAYEVVAVTLLLTGLEALSATGTTKWLRQLGCVRLMLAQLEQRQQSSYDAFALGGLRRHFTYHDAMATVIYCQERDVIGPRSSSDTRDANESTDRSPTDSSAMASSPNPSSAASSSTGGTFDGIDPLMGIAAGLFEIICRIRYLPSGLNGLELTATTQFRALESGLREWRPGGMGHSRTDGLYASLDLIALAETYRLSGLILLYRHVDRSHSMLPSLGLQSVHMAERIPKGSPAEAGLTFPLFLSGAELRQESDIELCLAKLNAMHARYKLENIGKATTVLEQVFRARLNGHAEHDWEDVLRERGWSTSLS
jgi:transcriptional activator protein UGA3